MQNTITEMYRYWGFGLHIQSEIEFPELIPASFDTADVTIFKGTVTNTVIGTNYDGVYSSHSINEKECFLDMKSVCKYHVSNGNKIMLDPYEYIDARSIRIFILGTVMTALLLQRGLMPLHCSAIKKDGKLILFTGDSGAGKSTTIAQLALKNYKTFSDDICVLQYVNDDDGERIVASASYPMIKLWKNSTERLNDPSFSNEDFNVRKGYEKYGHFFKDKFDTGTYPIDKIFVLTKDEMPAEHNIEQLSGIKAFKELEVAIFRQYQMNGKVAKVLYFKIISKLIAECLIYKLNVQSGYENKEGYKPFPVKFL